MTPTDPKGSASARPAGTSGHRAGEPLYADPHAHDRFHAAHGHAEHDGLYNEDVAHEHSDVNVRALLMSAAGLALVVIACAGIVYGLFIVFERQAAGRDIVSPLARPSGQLPPAPRLLTDEPQNLERFRAEEGERLQGIDDAKRQLLQQGLPVRSDAPDEAWMGTRSPARGESSGGRAIPLTPGGQK